MAQQESFMGAFVVSSHPIVSHCHPIMVRTRFRAAAAMVVVGDVHPINETVFPVFKTLYVV